MPLFFKSIPGILLLSLPPYLYFYATVIVSLRRLRPVSMELARKRGILISAVCLHAVPLVFFLHMILNAAVLGETLPEARAVFVLGVLYLSVGAILIAAQSACILVPLHLVLFALDRFLRDHRTNLRVIGAAVSLVVVCLATVYVPGRMIYDRMTMDADAAIERVPGLPRGLWGFRIAVLADIQSDAYTGTGQIKAYIDKAAREQPMLLLFAGDIAGSERMEHIVEGVRALASIPTAGGTYCVLGDHDFWSGPERVASELARQGMPLRLNEIVQLRVNDTDVDILCLTNILNDPADDRRVDSLLSLRRAGSFSILLTHQLSDRIAEQCIAAHINLVAAGHTHGGQIAMNIFGFRLTPSMLDTRYISGYYREGKTLIYIANGLGTSVVPVRYGATPGFGVVTLLPG